MKLHPIKSAWSIVYYEGPQFIFSINVLFLSEDQFCLGSAVAECLTGDQAPAGLSLTGVTVLWSFSKTHLSWLSTGSTQEDPSLFN